jgi:hypothetical protein
MLAPGLAMLSTSPDSIGSISRSIPTMGIVFVAFLAAANAQLPRAKITSTGFESCAHAPIYENVSEFNEKTLSFLNRPVK